MEWLEDLATTHGFSIPNWPPNSLDLNPIENLWAEAGTVARIAEPPCGYIFWASPTHAYRDISQYHPVCAEHFLTSYLPRNRNIVAGIRTQNS